jgi:hypothetical protein
MFFCPFSPSCRQGRTVFGAQAQCDVAIAGVGIGDIHAAFINEVRAMLSCISVCALSAVRCPSSPSFFVASVGFVRVCFVFLELS